MGCRGGGRSLRNEKGGDARSASPPFPFAALAHSPAPIYALALAVALSACERGAPERELSVRTVIGRTPHVSTSARARESAPVWQLAIDLRIGGADSGPADLDAVWDIAVDRANRIYLLLTRRSEVRVFDSTGRFVRRIGSRGKGPGELTAPTKLAFDTTGRLWVSDPSQRKYVVFDTAGRTVREYILPSRFQCRPSPCGSFLSDGRHLDGELSVSRGAMPHTRLFLVDSAGARSDSIDLPSADSTPPASFQPSPFAPRVVFAVDPAGLVWFGNSARYSLAAVDFGRDTAVVVDVTMAPVPLADADRTAYAERLRDLAPAIGLENGASQRALPATKPLIAQIVAGSDRSVWVATAEAADGAAQWFDVFGRDGALRARVHSSTAIAVTPLSAPPMNPSPILIVGDRLYATVVDGDGLLHVVRAVVRK